MQAKYKEELQQSEVVLNEQKGVLEGTLAPRIMTRIETALEKMLIIRTNEAEVEAAIEKARLATSHLTSYNDSTPEEIIFKDVFHNDP